MESKIKKAEDWIREIEPLMNSVINKAAREIINSLTGEELTLKE